MDKFELGIAVQKVYDFIWEEFCDWYIEIAKVRLYKKEEDPKAANTALWTLKTVLTSALKLLHPYMPFITEEIFCTLQSGRRNHHACSDGRNTQRSGISQKKKQMLETIKRYWLRASVTFVHEMNVPPSRKAKVFHRISETENLCETVCVHEGHLQPV